MGGSPLRIPGGLALAPGHGVRYPARIGTLTIGGLLMPDYPHTWREAVADAHTAAAEAFAYAVKQGENLDGGAEYDAAHDFADGSEWVVYTYRARCLWFDNAEVQDAEGDALESADASYDIDSRIRLCVYHALADAFAEKWRELAEAHAETAVAQCEGCNGTGAVPATGAEQYAGDDDNGLVPCGECGGEVEQ